MKLKKLTKRELETFLKKHKFWQTNSKQTELTRTVATKNFIDGLVLIARLSVHAEISNHHPDIILKYNQLKIKLSTHEIKNVSKKDLELATRIDLLIKD